jgi:DNA-binding phage protein
MAIETTKWDPAEHLDSKEAVAAYIDAAFARAEGMTKLSRETGLPERRSTGHSVPKGARNLRPYSRS